MGRAFVGYLSGMDDGKLKSAGNCEKRLHFGGIRTIIFTEGENMMKILFVFVAFLLVTDPVFAALSPEDIRIIREEVTAIVKAENAELEKRMQGYVDLKFEVLDTKFTTKFEGIDKQFEGIDKQFEGIDKQFEAVDKKQNFILTLVTSLIALIVLAIGIPQIIIALKQKDYRALEDQIKTLQEKVELMEETRLVKPD